MQLLDVGTDAHGCRKQHRAIRQQHWAIQHGYHVTEPNYPERIAGHDSWFGDQSQWRQSGQHNAAGHDSGGGSESEPDSRDESEHVTKLDTRHRSQYESGYDTNFAGNDAEFDESFFYESECYAGDESGRYNLDSSSS